MIFGAGAPSASHAMVASLPSNAVRFLGPLIMMGDEAGREMDENVSEITRRDNAFFFGETK